MLIECIIKRNGGTRITFGPREYNFIPNSKGQHVCEVRTAAHRKALLAVKESFRAVVSPTSTKLPKSISSTLTIPTAQDFMYSDKPPTRAALRKKYKKIVGDPPDETWDAWRIAQEMQTWVDAHGGPPSAEEPV